MLSRIQRNILAGVLIVVPIWLTILVVRFLIDLLIRFGSPTVAQLAKWFEPTSPILAALFKADWFQSTVAIILVLAALGVTKIVLSEPAAGRRALGRAGRLRRRGRRVGARPRSARDGNAT